jgi:hypothetical protein
LIRQYNNVRLLKIGGISAGRGVSEDQSEVWDDSG